MTEQPKFQRRKRRGADAPVDTPDHRPSNAQKPDFAGDRASKPEPAAPAPRKSKIKAIKKHPAPKAAAPVSAKRISADSDSRPEPARDHDTPVPGQPVKPRTVEVSKPPLILERRPEPKVQSQPVFDPETAWYSIDRFPLDPQRLAARNVITALREDPSHSRFDILRTRMLQALSENGWRRVAITSPTKDCGKTFTAANLAVSLSRHETCRTVLLDLDMRSPSLHNVFGVSDTGAIGDMLRGKISPEAHLQGFAPNTISAGSHVAVGFNGIVEPYASELLQDPSTEAVLDEIEAAFQPDVMLFDLPPALLNDDVIAMRPHVDALLIVAAGGITRAKDIKETERRLGENMPLLGVVLNKAEHIETSEYSY
ncbi:MAG: exopolysaccharide biosynthesis protein [Marivita sp. XM-24bin2]|jgi:Mrp family chromosome partitioning ATPase|uniref:CpsD/CapB family tyrosine-protein kinase n=1 Tax=Marivita sp. TaxID=2003365 RepID=UPI000D79EFC9|nr:MAG: exopolysaccharide biosynthesis protein [Marivita sp. XM-24bin2]